MASHCYQHKILNMANSMAWPLSSSAVACDLFSLSLCFHHFGILSVSSRILSSLPLQFFHMCFPIYLTHSTAFSSPGQLALILQVFILNVTFSGKKCVLQATCGFPLEPLLQAGIKCIYCFSSSEDCNLCQVGTMFVLFFLLHLCLNKYLLND